MSDKLFALLLLGFGLFDFLLWILYFRGYGRESWSEGMFSNKFFSWVSPKKASKEERNWLLYDSIKLLFGILIGIVILIIH